MSPERRRAAAALAAALLLGCVAALQTGCAPRGDTTVIFLVRHAEKTADREDPELTVEGAARAGELAALLADAGITAIHSTDFRRTRETAAPLATRLGLEIRNYHWDDMEVLARVMRREGGRHLVVGHSDTTPELVGLLGGEPGPPIDEATEYDRLYVVTIGPDGEVTTLLLHYGV